MRKSRVLYHFPHPFFPVRTGAHVRVLEALQCLRRVGFEVSVAYASLDWMPQTPFDRLALASALCKNVFFYEDKSRRQNRLRRPDLTIEQLSNIASGKAVAKTIARVDPFRKVDNGMRKWFSECVSAAKPDVVFMCYPTYAGLLAECSDALTVIELYDTDALNGAMQGALLDGGLMLDKNRLNGPSADDAYVLDRTFLSSVGCRLSPEEFLCIQAFDAGIALTVSDEKVLQSAGLDPTTHIPVMTEVREQRPAYESGDACLMLGPNYFNLQGLLHLDRKVWPMAQTLCPQIRLNVCGSVPHFEDLRLNDGIKKLGFVADPRNLLEASSFFVNPVFSGTGMQIKTVEAMANGLAVICYPEVAEAVGIQHGINGYVASNEKDFAQGIASLFSDRHLAAEMGQLAREHVKTQLCRNALDQRMEAFMSKLLGG